MHAIKIETTVDEATAQAIPALRPLLGKRVELIALESPEGEGSGAPGAAPRKKLTFEELLAKRTVAPPGTPPITDEDIEAAIIEGAVDGHL